METTTTSSVLRIGRLQFTVETTAPTGDCPGSYVLTGVRGARYRTMRNVHHGWMFLVDAGGRGRFGIVTNLASVRLSDANGALEVVS
jgi:hypothetical protein